MRKSALYRAVMSPVSSATMLAVVAGTVSFSMFAQAPAVPAKPSQGKAKAAAKSGPTPIATMSQLMIDIIYPTSNDIFYIFREPPKTDVEWGKMRQSALSLGEAANLLMAPERRFDDDTWMEDAQLLLDVGKKAYALARAKDDKGMADLNDELYTACVICHEHYRPRYGTRELPGRKQ